MKVAFCLIFRGAYIREGIIFGGKFVLVIRGAYIRGAYIRGGAYIRDFTVYLYPLINFSDLVDPLFVASTPI